MEMQSDATWRDAEWWGRAQSVVLAVVSVIAWIAWAHQLDSASNAQGSGLAAGLTFGVAIMASVFSAAGCVIAWVASLLRATIERIHRDAVARGSS